MKKVIVFIIVGILLVVYFIFLFDTNSVINDFRDVVKGEIEQNTEYGALMRYDSTGYPDFSKANVQVHRLFVKHDFKEGHMYVCYTIELYNDKGENIAGSWNVISKWCIKKIDGRWQITNIQEAP